MKITKLLSLLLLSLVFLSNGCNEDENLEVEGNCDAPRCYITKTSQTFRGIPEGSTTWQYKTLNGEKVVDKTISESDATLYSEMIYDNNNRITGSKAYSDNRLTYEIIVTYNSNGQRATVTTTDYQNGSRDEDKTIFEYDSENRLKNRKYYRDGNLKGEHVIEEYNSFGQPTISRLYDENGELTETLRYDYDCSTKNTKYISNNLRESFGHDQVDILFVDCESNCRLNQAISTYPDNRTPEKLIIEYDERGLTKSYYSVKDGEETKVKTYFEYECD